MGKPGPHPTSESAPYATRTQCRPPAPGPWTPTLPWTQRARPPELGKPRGRGFPQRPQPSSSSTSRSTREDRCPSRAHRRVSRICHFLAIVDNGRPARGSAASIGRRNRPSTAFRFRGCFDVRNPLQHNPGLADHPAPTDPGVPCGSGNRFTSRVVRDFTWRDGGFCSTGCYCVCGGAFGYTRRDLESPAPGPRRGRTVRRVDGRRPAIAPEPARPHGSDNRGSVNLMPVGMAVGGDGSTVVQGRVEHRRGQLHGGGPLSGPAT